MNEIKKLTDMRAALLKKLAAKAGWIQGSVVETTAGKGHARRPFRYLSRSVKGKNRITYVSDTERPGFKKSTSAWRSAKSLIESISEVNIKIIKNGGKP